MVLRIRCSRHRQPPARPDQAAPYLKFLKPGALAQLRDSRLSARWTHRSSSVSAILPVMHSSPPPSPPLTAAVQPQPDAITTTATFEGFPRFSPHRICYPRCPQRKKLLASKTVLFLNPSVASAPVSDSPGNIIGALNNDSIVVAH